MKDRIEIRLRDRGWFFQDYPESNIHLCPSRVRAYVRLPDRVSYLAIVFTKRRNSASFEIRLSGGLVGVSTRIVEGTRRTFRRYRAQGYKYVHLEYEERG